MAWQKQRPTLPRERASSHGISQTDSGQRSFERREDCLGAPRDRIETESVGEGSTSHRSILSLSHIFLSSLGSLQLVAFTAAAAPAECDKSSSCLCKPGLLLGANGFLTTPRRASSSPTQRRRRLLSHKLQVQSLPVDGDHFVSSSRRPRRLLLFPTFGTFFCTTIEVGLIVYSHRPIDLIST